MLSPRFGGLSTGSGSLALIGAIGSRIECEKKKQVTNRKNRVVVNEQIAGYRRCFVITCPPHLRASVSNTNFHASRISATTEVI